MTLSAPVLSLLDATPDDMSAVLRIYTHHVLYGAASFEEQPPTLTEMQLRLSKVREAGLPGWWRKAKAVLSATAMPRRIAPAGLSLYRGRLGIYRRRATGQRRRQGAAERADRPLRARSRRQMLAIVGDSAANRGSLALHQSLGFTSAGTLKAVGFKLGNGATRRLCSARWARATIGILEGMATHDRELASIVKSDFIELAPTARHL